jgi:hypothetical protein
MGALEYDVRYLNSLVALIDLKLGMITDKAAKAEYLRTISALWMPKVQPLEGAPEYNTPEYNTIEALCLAIRTVLRSL